MKVRLLALFVSAAALSVGLSPNGALADPVMHEVEFGEFTAGVPGEVVASFPDKLLVHTGDTIHFANALGSIPETGVHLVSLLPADIVLEEWLDDDYRSPEGSFAPFISDPDEAPAEAPAAWKLNNKHMFPSHPYCGHAEQAPCDFDGSEGPLNGILNAGAGYGVDTFLDFYVRITAEPGTTIWAICPFHPGIRIQIKVVDESQALPSDQQAPDAIARRMPAYEKQALALHRAYVNKQLARKGPGGTKIWEAWPGLSRGPLMLVGMYPRALAVEQGDAVRFNFPKTAEAHTVTMPLDKAGQIPWLGFQCDPDTDSGPLPDVASAPVPPFCPGGPLQVEADLAHEFPFPIGEGVFIGDADFETSGVRGAAYPGLTTGPYLVRFPVISPADGFAYACLLHPTMRGSIIVE